MLLGVNYSTGAVFNATPAPADSDSNGAPAGAPAATGSASSDGTTTNLECDRSSLTQTKLPNV